VSASREDPYALDDAGLLGAWCLRNPEADTQASVIRFLVELCEGGPSLEGQGSDIVWAPVEDGFKEVPITWVVDHELRLVRLAMLGEHLRST